MLSDIANHSASKGLQDLQQVFDSLERPYGLGEIIRFNRSYQRIYFELSREDKLRAEEYVEALIRGVERRELASRIFGVV
jgi:hypothetical protein